MGLYGHYILKKRNFTTSHIHDTLLCMFYNVLKPFCVQDNRCERTIYTIYTYTDYLCIFSNAD